MGPRGPHRRRRRHGHLGKRPDARRSLPVMARIISVTTPPAKMTQGAMTRRSESVTLPPGDARRHWRPVSRAAQSQLPGSPQCTPVRGMSGEACVVVVWSRGQPGRRSLVCEIVWPVPRGRRRPAVATTILLVEDERRLRELVRSYLERGGFTVLSAGSGAEAL